jgi:tRNA A37 N6-isopentenylltransferase MiaA
MPYEKALVLIGPTTTGKTEVAFEVAKRTQGEIVNGDRYYLFDAFPITSGFSDTLKLHQETGVPIHLYQVLNHHDEFPKDPDFFEMVNKKVHFLLERGVLPIVEGCTVGLLPCMQQYNYTVHMLYNPMITLAWDSDVTAELLKDRIRKRIDRMIAEGAIDEVRRYMALGYKDTLLRVYDMIISPTADDLESGEPIDIDSLKTDIAKFCFDDAVRQLEFCRKGEGDVLVMPHNPANLEGTVERIIEMLGR